MSTPIKWGSEFLVNTTTSSIQSEPTITALADGRFVVAWQDQSQSGGDTSGSAIRAQLHNADGSKSGAEFLVNTTTVNSQYEPSITALADGRFAVAWTDESETGGDTSTQAVRAQIFNRDGSLSGAEFLVSTTTTNAQTQPTLTALADGRFVVAWTDNSQTGGDTSSFAVRAQIFNADGSLSGAEFLVNTTTASFQFNPTIAALADGRFVVAWTDTSLTGGDTSSFAVRAQVFNADGSLSGAEFLVNTTTDSNQTEPTITALADGRLVVAWMDFSQTGEDVSGSAVRAQVFNADGSRSGVEFLVNRATFLGQLQPALTALADGRFMAVWTDDSRTLGDDSGYAIHAQVFNPDGTTSGQSFRVNTGMSSDQSSPAVTTLADGRVVVTWQSAGDGFAQVVDPRLTAVELFGSALAEDYLGTAWNDRLWGGFGNDVLAGAAGSDLLYGEWGNDTLKGGGGNDRLYGGQGDDSQLGGAGGDELWGDVGNDTLNGGAGADALIGGAGNDTYVVDTLADLVIENAAEGDDTVSSALLSLNLASFANLENASLLGSAALNATGNNGINRLTGNAGGNTLLALGGNDTVSGSGGNDSLDGGTGNDLLDGGIGIDTLVGGAGLDTLYGGTSRDLLTGGADADVFAWRNKGEAGNGINRDVVYDFEVGLDQLHLSAIDAHELLASDQAFSFIGAAVFTGVAGQLRYAGGILQGDTNGDAVGDFQVQLVGNPAITAADLVL